MPRRPFSIPPLVRAAVVLSWSFVAAGAYAQSNPYILRASQEFTYDSNLFREAPGGNIRRDGISTTSVGAGIDQHYGRQRYLADANVSYNVYKNNDQLNAVGYDLLLGMDWAAAQRLAGTIRLTSSQVSARFEDFEGANQKNLVRSNAFAATARYGLVGTWSLEGAAGYRNVSYSDERFDDRDLRLGYVSAGLRYRPHDLLNLGMRLRYTDGSYPDFTNTLADDFNRRDLEFFVNWRVTGLSTIDGQIALTSEKHDDFSGRDFDGTTGSIRWLYQPTAKSRFTAGLSRDTRNQGATGESLSQVSSDSRLSTRLFGDWRWDATAKVAVTLRGSYSRDRYDFGTADETGKGNTRSYGIGLSYAATRAWTFGCEVTRLSRSADVDRPGVNYNYKANVASCSAQFAIQ